MRRCNSMEACDCQIGAPKRFSFLDLPIANILSRPQHEWGLIRKSNRIKVAKHEIAVDWSEFNNDKYLFTHATIVASVGTDETGYRITAPCDELVNANGNAWTNQVIPHCFRTFCGAENYYEHIQIPELSKGKILDAVLRPVVYIGRDGVTKANVYYVDILVATNRKHEELVDRIENRDLSTLSMGAIANWTQCSACGKKMDDYTPNCKCLEHNQGRYIVDSKGRRIIVAELCGILDAQGNYVKDSCNFIEASWVEQPAFGGAVLNHIVTSPVVKMDDEKMKLAFLFEDERSLSRLKVADRKTHIAIRLALAEARRFRYQGIVENIVRNY